MRPKASAITVSVGVLAVSVIAAVLGVSTSAQSTPTCGGTPATIVSSEKDTAVYGTAGDDVVILSDSTPYYGNGGTDTICDAGGNVLAKVANDDDGPTVPPKTPDVAPSLTPPTDN